MIINQQQSTTLRPVLALALLAGLTATSSAQIANLWRYDQGGLASGVDRHTVLNNVLNNTTSNIQYQPNTIVSIRSRKITGYSSFGPAWTIKFDPLQNTTVTYDCAPNGAIVAPGNTIRAWVEWTREVGFETHRYAGSSLTATRDRDWNVYYNHELVIF